MELELNIDPNGRTTYDKHNFIQGKNCEGKRGGSEDVDLDYSCKTVATTLAEPSDDSEYTAAAKESHRNRLDELLYDCEIVDCGLLPRTFWMPATGTKPRCTLEQMALDVFHHHVPADYVYDESSSGAEWWVQLRPSPAGGRYSMHDSDPDEMSRTGISFHWDKDEELRLLMGGSMYIHPHISTVTYLTDLGAPTMVMNCRIDTFTGKWIVPGESEKEQEDKEVRGFLSWPKQGKHMSFDGRFLHAAPPDLMETGLFEKQCRISKETSNPESKEATAVRSANKLRRRHRRVTFLVNIWLNYKPLEVDVFPDSMIDKLSAVDESGEPRLFHCERVNQPISKKTSAISDISVPSKEGTACNGETDFVWPLGGCGSRETLNAKMPLEDIRKEASNGGDISVRWNSSVHLVKGDPPQLSENVGANASLTAHSSQVESKPSKRARAEHDG